jgi:V/A-type H+-transporting ATPase subunit E
MGLDEVVADIEAAAAADAAAILKEAAQERDKLLAEAREKARSLTEERLAEAQRQLDRTRVREIAGAELEVKRARLSMERDLLAAAAEGAARKVSALPRDQDEALLLAILRKAASPGFRIFGAPKNEAFLRTRLEYSFAGDIDCLGGVLLESPDGSVRMDFTYEAILRDVVERTTKDIYDLLFRR